MKTRIFATSIRSATAEILSIVIAVLLALAVSEWNDNRVKNARSEEALTNIIREIEANIEILQLAHDNNKATLAEISRRRQSGEDGEDLSFLPALQIQDTAWSTTVSTGISEFLPYDTLYKISGIYSLQEIYKSLSFQFIQSMMSHKALVDSLRQDVEGQTPDEPFYDNMKLLVEVETALLSLYEVRLQQLSGTGNQ